MRKLLSFVVVTLALLTAAAQAQKPPINGVAGPTTSGELGSIMPDATGTGSYYRQNGDLGTPSAGDLTNATNLPAGTGLTGIVAPGHGGSGVANASSSTVTLTGAIWASGPQSQIVMGAGAMPTLSSGTNGTIAIGDGAYAANTSDAGSVGIGLNVAGQVPGGQSNVFVGINVAQYAGNNSANTFLGGFSGRGGHSDGPRGTPLTGGTNVGVGEASCLLLNGTSAGNICIGFNALYGTGQANSNVAVGGNTSTNLSTGTSNVTMGNVSYRFGNGSLGVIIGTEAGNGDATTLVTTGSNAQGQPVINVVSTTGVVDGDAVWSCCTEVPATVLSHTATTITLNNNIFTTFGAGFNVFAIHNLHSGLGAVVIGEFAAVRLSGASAPTIVGGGAATDGYTNQAGFTAIGTNTAAHHEGVHITAIGANTLQGASGSHPTGGFSTVVGSQSLKSLNSTDNGAHSVLGYSDYVNQTGGTQGLIGLGSNLGGTCLTCSSVILIGLNTDVPASNTSNYLNVANTIYATGIGGTPLVGISNSTPAQALDVTGAIKTSLAVVMTKVTASGTAPGAANVKFEAVCGTGAGTAKIQAYAGTSATPTTVVDNVGAGVTGC